MNCGSLLCSEIAIEFVEFGGHVYQQTIGIPMGTNCAPLLADLFLYSYETEFMQQLQKGGARNQLYVILSHIQIY